MPLESESPDELLGVTIAGRYRIISRLGAGGMGVAYRAWDEQGSVPVVIKIPKRIFLADSKFTERFHREIRLLQGLKHPHIVPIVDVGDHERLPFVVMRFLPGGSLSNRRLRDDQGKPRPNPPAMLHLWLPAVAEALDYVHSQGVVHRDVKPGNIFFDAFWGAYLGDFGIAKIVEETDMFDKEQTLTATHVGIGTQEYMAPEQFTPKAVIDGRADQYALAVMVYEMLAGGRPFTGSTAHIVVEVTTYPVPPLPVRRSDVSPMLIQAVHKALSKQPAERFATCGEFAAAVLRDVPMMRDEPGVARLLCPQCSNILKLPTTAADQKGKCPRCQTQMRVAADLGSLWLLEEARKQRKSTGVGGQETPVTPIGEIDEKALETFKPVSSETPIGPGRTTRLPSPPVLAGGAAVAIALLVLVIAVFGGSRDSGRAAPTPKPSPPKPYPVRLGEALKTLEHDPRDRGANDFLARHYCFQEQDWNKGLPYLASSGTPLASVLAQEEIAAIETKPIIPVQFIRIARKWWDYSGRTDLNTPESTAAMCIHAVDLYSRHIAAINDPSDADWVNGWLDADKDFARLVWNLRPQLPAVPAALSRGLSVHCYKFEQGEQPDFRAVNATRKPDISFVHPLINFPPVDGAFAGFGIEDRFHVVWDGVIYIEKAGRYRFFLSSDDGSKLAIDGRSVIDNGGLHPMSEKNSDVDLTAGDHSLYVELFEDAGGAGCILSWQPPGGLKEVVPDRVLFHRKKPLNLTEINEVESPGSAANRSAAEAVVKRGGSIEIEMADKSRRRIDRLARLPVEPFVVTSIDLTAKSGVADESLAFIQQLPRLEGVAVGGTPVTDAIFGYLHSLPNLRSIGVNWTRVSGHGLATLADAQLKHLEISGMKEPEVAVAYLHKKGVAEWINFDGMKMSSECVRLLGEMKTLKALHFRAGLITLEQLESLRRQLPACHIHVWK